MARILVVEDEAPLRQSVVIALRRAGHQPAEAGTLSDGLTRLAEEDFDLLLVDLRLPDGDGLDIIRRVQAQCPDTPAVVMTAYGTVDVAVEAMKCGAFDFLQKPFVPERLLACALRALDHGRLRSELRRRRAAEEAPVLVGTSPAMERVRDLIERATHAEVVLVTGETGTGKDLVARAIHARHGGDSSCVIVNCGALSRTLVESELFGHVHGAFTGADRARRGLFAEADGGTAFLDEVGELPLETQAGLLRFLETGEFRPVGANDTRRVSCRVIAATHRDLAQAVENGTFRQDLYYRLDRYRIHVPPLRERPQDIEPLAETLLARIAGRLGTAAPTLDPEVLAVLRGHAFPGNVRELEHALERALVLAGNERITPDLLFLGPDPAAHRSADAGPEPLAAIERQHILRVLEHAAGDRARAAAILGISKSTLRRKLISYGLWQKRADESD